jgi:Na+/glutamate symporter
MFCLYRTALNIGIPAAVFGVAVGVMAGVLIGLLLRDRR